MKIQKIELETTWRGQAVIELSLFIMLENGLHQKYTVGEYVNGFVEHDKAAWMLREMARSIEQLADAKAVP